MNYSLLILLYFFLNLVVLYKELKEHLLSGEFAIAYQDDPDEAAKFTCTICVLTAMFGSVLYTFFTLTSITIPYVKSLFTRY